MNATPITIRPYLPRDRCPLERTGEAVADPFEPTAHLVAMLRATP